jgi:hypothetical protein
MKALSTAILAGSVLAGLAADTVNFDDLKTPISIARSCSPARESYRSKRVPVPGVCLGLFSRSLTTTWSRQLRRCGTTTGLAQQLPSLVPADRKRRA